jgi:hypothetical protein
MTLTRGSGFRRRGLAIAGAVVLLLTLSASVSLAVAASSNTSSTPEGVEMAGSSTDTTQASTPATSTRVYIPPGTPPYNMDFTLPTLGKAGCMVCHGDRNLIRIRGDQYVSYYVDDAVVRASAHGNVMCTGCHLDFAYKSPHGSDDWRETSKLACKNCHQTQYDAFGQGAHAVNSRPGQVDAKAAAKPLCGDCHGAHDIRVLSKNPASRAALRADGYQICGRCHQKEWDNYADYYHGAAYRRGASDAPACWDCHGPHTIRPSSDVQSPTNPANLAETCSGNVTGRSCHQGTSASFLEYASLIHQRNKALQENQLYATVTKVREGISAVLSNIVETVRRLVT